MVVIPDAVWVDFLFLPLHSPVTPFHHFVKFLTGIETWIIAGLSVDVLKKKKELFRAVTQISRDSGLKQ